MKPTTKINIEGLNPLFNPNSIEVSSSWKNLTDTLKLKIPRNVIVEKGRKKLTEVIKVGGEVSVEAGYNWDLKPLYSGVIAYLKTDIPIEINCEDLMWKLKRSSFSGSWKNVSLKTLLQEILEPLNIKYKNHTDAELGKRRYEKSTPALVLKDLRENFGLYSFFVGDTLYVGTPNLHSLEYADTKPITFDMKRDVISTNLEYLTAEQKKIKVEAVSLLPNNKTLKTSIGDSDGETHTLHFYNIGSEKELKKRAEAEMSRLKISGYKGDFTTFGYSNRLPKITHGMVVNIVDYDYPEHAGNYKVEGVTTTVSTSEGFRQKINIGIRV